MPIKDYKCPRCFREKDNELTLKMEEKIVCECGQVMISKVCAPALGNMGANGTSVPQEQGIPESWVENN
jgi:hypothetical protein